MLKYILLSRGIMKMHNRKILIFEKFKEYIKKKNEANLKICGFYQRTLFRELKLGSFMMRQQTEAKMLKNIWEFRRRHCRIWRL